MAGDGGKGGCGFAFHGGVVDIGESQGFVTGEVGFAEGGERVGGFAGLRDDHDGGVGEGLLGAVGVLAGVLDVDRDAAEVLDEEFGEEAGVAAGTAGSDDNFGVDVLEPSEDRGAGVAAELVAVYVAFDRGGEGGGLLKNLAQHPVSERGRFDRCGHRVGIPHLKMIV